MTHVGAVGQIVRAELACHELIEERCFVAQPTGRVKGCLVWTFECAQFTTYQVEGVLPGDWPVAVGGSVVDERLGKSPLIFQCEVGPRRQLGNGVLSEEVGADSLVCHLPGDVLNAVLANVEPQPLAVVGPRASWAVEPTVLVVHLVDRPRAVY